VLLEWLPLRGFLWWTDNCTDDAQRNVSESMSRPYPSDLLAERHGISPDVLPVVWSVISSSSGLSAVSIIDGYWTSARGRSSGRQFGHV
jgi:hypothetical protein